MNFVSLHQEEIKKGYIHTLTRSIKLINHILDDTIEWNSNHSTRRISIEQNLSILRNATLYPVLGDFAFDIFGHANIDFHCWISK